MIMDFVVFINIQWATVVMSVSSAAFCRSWGAQSNGWFLTTPAHSRINPSDLHLKLWDETKGDQKDSKSMLCVRARYDSTIERFSFSSWVLGMVSYGILKQSARGFQCSPVVWLLCRSCQGLRYGVMTLWTTLPTVLAMVFGPQPIEQVTIKLWWQTIDRKKWYWSIATYCSEVGKIPRWKGIKHWGHCGECCKNDQIPERIGGGKRHFQRFTGHAQIAG